MENTTTVSTSTRPGFAPGELRQALWHIMIAWFFGAGFSAIIGSAAVISYLTKFLNTDDLTFSLIMAAGPSAVLFQFLGAYVTERTGRTKLNFLIFVSIHRLLWLGIALVPLFARHFSPSARVWITAAIIFISAALANYGGAGWTTWMSDIVPGALAGRFFGARASLGLISMVATSYVVSAFLDSHPNQPWVYALIFTVAGLMGATDIFLFWPIRDLQRPRGQTPTLTELFTIPWKDATFRGFTLYLFTAWIAYNSMGSFLARYCMDPIAKQGLGMNVTLTNVLIFVLPWVAMAVFSPFWGRAVDRLGVRPVLLASSLVLAVSPIGWMILRPGWLVFTVIVCLAGGVVWPGFEQSIIYMQVKGFPRERNAVYNATYLVVVGIATMLGVPLGGVLASLGDWTLAALHLPAGISHYQPLFVISFLMRIAALLFVFPRLLPGSGRLAQVPGTLLREIADVLPFGYDLRRAWSRK